MAALTASLAGMTQTRRLTTQFHLIWLVDNLDKLKKDFAQSINDLEDITGAMETFSDAESFTNYFFENTQKKVIVIASGALAENTVPLIHEAPHLDSVFIFCRAMAHHERWTKDLTKVKGLFKEINAMCAAVKQTIEQSESVRPRPARPLPESSPVVRRPLTPHTHDRPSSASRATTSTDSLAELQHTITTKVERDIRKSLLDHLGGLTSLKTGVTDGLEDIIKQAVADALKGQQIPRPDSNRKSIIVGTSPEIKITADTKRTRVDAAFRQQRDAVVADKKFRDLVSQWIGVSSMADLTAHIKAHGKNDLQCAWLLFCWIGQNIKYELNCNVNKAETVFRTRQAVCRGFASLYHECCTLLGIQCSEISGFAKDTFVKTADELKRSPHAWNTIVLDGFTYLVDPTWGAGGRDDQDTLEDFYFLTSPEEFIYSHYSMGSQLLAPEISKTEFLALPIVRSIYYQLGLHLLSPKQGVNQIRGNLFQISIRTPGNVELVAGLKVGREQYPRNLHTLCQRDATNRDVYNCYIAPPVDGLYEIDIFAKTNEETTYRGTINMRLQVLGVANAFTFPLIYSTFTDHHCALIEPLQRLVNYKEEVLIHMIIPHANVIRIQNGDDNMVPSNEEYKNGVLKKKVRVQGDLQVFGRWNDEADTISYICTFHMI